MSDIEFDIIDNLYFVTHYSALFESLHCDEMAVKETLWIMLKKGWLKCYEIIDKDISPSKEYFDSFFKDYFYLASKKGLLLHNAL